MPKASDRGSFFGGGEAAKCKDKVRQLGHVFLGLWMKMPMQPFLVPFLAAKSVQILTCTDWLYSRSLSEAMAAWRQRLETYQHKEEAPLPWCPAPGAGLAAGYGRAEWNAKTLTRRQLTIELARQVIGGEAGSRYEDAA